MDIEKDLKIQVYIDNIEKLLTAKESKQRNKDIQYCIKQINKLLQIK